MTWLLNPLVPIEQEARWAPSCDLDAMEKTVLPVLGVDPLPRSASPQHSYQHFLRYAGTQTYVLYTCSVILHQIYFHAS